MSAQLPLTSPPKNICILRLSALGDVSHVIPVVRLIQAQWPECDITWVCGKFEHKLLRLLPGINFVVFDKKAGWKAYYLLWKSLRNRRFDVLLHMQVAARANLASRMIRAKIRLGWDKPRSRDLHQLFINHSVPAAVMQHQVDGFLSFAETLGLQSGPPQWNLPLTQKARSFAQAHVLADKPLLVISACSSHALRNWRAEAYAQVADYAVERYGFQVILSGGPAPIEVEMAESIQRQMTKPVLNLVGKDTLEELLGLLQAADIVISPDSGPAHLANALAVPVIGLYACTWSKRSGPYNSLNYCVDKFEQAAGQFLGKKAEQLFWGTKIEKPGVMDLISVEEVCQQLDKLVEEKTLLKV
jgi:heptosyltransferase I